MTCEHGVPIQQRQHIKIGHTRHTGIIHKTKSLNSLVERWVAESTGVARLLKLWGRGTVGIEKVIFLGGLGAYPEKIYS